MISILRIWRIWIACASISAIVLSGCQGASEARKRMARSIDKPVVQYQLEGSAQDDGLPSGNLSIQWSQVSGPEPVEFENKADPRSRVTFLAAGDYVLRLTVSDGAISRSDEVRFTINP